MKKSDIVNGVTDHQDEKERVTFTNTVNIRSARTVGTGKLDGGSLYVLGVNRSSTLAARWSKGKRNWLNGWRERES